MDGDCFLLSVKVLPAFLNVLAPLPLFGWISSDMLLFKLSIQLVGLLGPGLLLRECIFAKVESNSTHGCKISVVCGGLLTATALLVGRLQQCGKLVEPIVTWLMNHLRHSVRQSCRGVLLHLRGGVCNHIVGLRRCHLLSGFILLLKLA